ncbi:protein kinase [Candidatus Uhrbacteria bacterium]|nr:protein kinase [Candidatus Uhrbacteria bacterium]
MPHDPAEKILKESRTLLAPLKRYEVESVLGRGAMGSVLRVRHDILGVRRALKLINPSCLGSETLRRRFFNEARVMVRLRGRHLVEVYEVDEVEGHPYIIMEYLEGGTIADHLDAFGPLPPRQAVGVAAALLTALETAHTHTDEDGRSSPIIHRDVKAENVLLTKSGTPKLGDFGIAHIDAGTRQLTGDVTTLGTIAYMAPEQQDARHVDSRADLYAVGVLLYVMLMNPEEMWRSSFHMTLGRHPDMMVGMLPELEEVIRTSTAEDREARYPSAQAMMAVLQALIDTLPENPQDMPSLGSAPAVLSRRQAPSAGADAAFASDDAPRPGAGGSSPALSSGLSSHAQEELRRTGVPPMTTSSGAGGQGEQHWDVPGGTFHDETPVSSTQFGREVALTRASAKRKFFTGLGVLLTVLAIVGVIIWNVVDMGKPTPSVVDVQPSVEVQPPPGETVPVHSAPPTVAPVSTPAAIVAPEVKTQKKVVKAIEPSVHSEVTPAAEKAQVQLILKEETVATIVFIGEGGTFTVSPANTAVTLPVGTYKASVQMEGRDGAPQTGTLILAPGTTTVTCTERLQKCTGLK